MQRLRILFEVHDENSDDELSKAEVEIMFLSCIRGMCKMVGRLEMSTQKIHGLSEYIFTSLDRDSNQMLSREEFLGFCKTCPEAVTYFTKVDDMKKFKQKPSERPSSLEENKAGFLRNEKRYKGRPEHPPFNAGATGGASVGRKTLAVPSYRPLNIDVSIGSPKLSPIPPNGISSSKGGPR